MWIKKKSRANLRKGSPEERAVPSSRLPTPLAEFEKVLHEATSSDDENSLPNVAAIAANPNALRDSIGDWLEGALTRPPLGRVLHSVSSGTFIPAGPGSATPQPFTADTVCWIASCTKLMTTVAALQCVERGLLSLNEDISSVLTEFKDIQILVSMDAEKGPVLRPATRKITLRNLLTHSSGLAYEITHPKLLAWRKWFNRQSPENKKVSKSMEASIAHRVPLMFEPDEGWVYGYGIDWAGVAVSRVSGLSLGAYMKKHIWDPLGMSSTTFSVPSERPDLLSRFAAMAARDLQSGKLIRGKSEEYVSGLPPVKESGGGGAMSTANDYIKFLIPLLKNDGSLLRPETVDLMFSPHLADNSHLMRMHAHAKPLAPGLAVHVPKGVRVDYGLGGLLNLEDIGSTGRKAGSMQWGGIPNLFWWINRKDGICGCFFEQLMPAGDDKSFEMFQRYEKAVNESFIREGREKL